MRVRHLAAATGLLLVGTLAPAVATADPGPPIHRNRPDTSASASTRADKVQVGTLTLHRCRVVVGALCGSIKRRWEPGNPGAGKVHVGFAFVPARDRHRPTLGTLVPHEGGPGYSTTGTGPWYAAMYGSLLQRRNLLLVDQRGTGRSEPIRCPELQVGKIKFAVAAGRCGRQLGDRADDYTTARSADDVAAVVRALRLGRIDMYGDSYGTFFAQVLAGRHPRLVRSIVLDSAYPAYGESGWYPTQGPAVRRAFRVVCARSFACRNADGTFDSALRRVLEMVRAHPWRGRSHDAEGTPMRVAVDGPALVDIAYGATFNYSYYREFTAALRSALQGDRAPLLRLVAEATGGATGGGSPRAYSEGLNAAVACHDYPQLYDMTAPPGDVRENQYAARLDARAASEPGLYGPFTIHEYAASTWQMLDWCTRWPVAPADNPAGPPRPPSGRYPDVPVLVLSGELDSITTAAQGRRIVGQFPNTRHIVVRNSVHVTAVSDTDDCAQRIVRSFVASPAARIPAALRRCAKSIAPVRALGIFPTSLRDVSPARAAALTVADLQDRWWNNYDGTGVGLRGGTWSYSGGRQVLFRLHGVRLVRGLAVSGTAHWDRNAGSMSVRLRLSGKGPRGHLRGRWDTKTVGARAVLTGPLDGKHVRVWMPAP